MNHRRAHPHSHSYSHSHRHHDVIYFHPAFALPIPLSLPNSVVTRTSRPRTSRPRTSRSLLALRTCPLAALPSLSSFPSLPSLPSLPLSPLPRRPAAGPVRNAHIAVLTDFSSNPLAAIRDRTADPVFVAMLLAAALAGALLARVISFIFSRRAPSASRQLSSSALVSPRAPIPPPAPPDLLPSMATPTPGENAVWLNMTISSLWRLFRKSTASLTREVLQPALDNVDLPSFVKSVHIERLSLGASPALVRQLRRIPSRSLSELHYRLTTRLIGAPDGYIDLTVKIKLPILRGTVTIPVRVSALDVDADIWLALTVAPFSPFLRSAQWALVDPPDLRLQISLGPYLPLTAIPVLSSALERILTVELPRQFLLPRVQLLDIAPRESEGDAESEDADAAVRFPKLAALFDSLDIDGNGVLSCDEVATGLMDWGFASALDRAAISNALDVNRDGVVHLDEFTEVWPRLKDVFVPRKFRGVLSGVLLEAKGLRAPMFGSSDPYIVLTVEGQSMTSRKDSQTSNDDTQKGTATWNEVSYVSNGYAPVDALPNLL